METAHIQKMIDDQFADSSAIADLRELLMAVAERQGIRPGALELSRGANFICNYIEQVPYLLTVAWTAARSVGLETEMQSILQMVKSYWIEDDDVIPDTIGIVGLLDDAYCSLSSLQAVSDLYRMQSGKFLFPDDLTAANKAMHKIIGEPYVTELDAIVDKAIADADVKESVKALASPEKRRLLEDQATIWNHGPVSEMPVSKLGGLGLGES